MLDSASSPAFLAFVGAEVRSDLERFVALLSRWQTVHNLISPSSVADLWRRHVEDSLQLIDHAPASFHRWVDMGSGAGFPGLVVAIGYKEQRERSFVLVESNRKKAAFLRAAIREVGVQAQVAAERIESYGAACPGSADVVSARALAPINELCGPARAILKPDGVLLLLKGQGYQREAEAASAAWEFNMETAASVTDPQGRILSIRDIRPKVPS